MVCNPSNKFSLDRIGGTFYNYFVANL
jgi:hypothetical protein